MPHTPPRPSLLRRRRHDLLALALVLLVALLPRIVELGADPPARVLGAFLSDEGWWAQNARQRVLFGEWVMDEHNPALFAAPAYTAALTLTYQLAGLGLAQTRLLSALAGALACGVFYLGLRAVMPTRRALPPALLLALGGFGILLSRMALVETLQLAFAILAMAGVLAATRYPPLGALGGLGLVGAVLSKPNAVILGPVFAVAWWFDYRQRRRTDEPLRPLALQIAAFSGAVACSVVAVLVLFIWPNWHAVRDQLAVSLANVTTQDNRLADGGVLVFFLPFLSLRPSLLFLEGVVPMLGLALLVWRRVARPLAEPLDPAERLGWAWWWGVLAYVASQALGLALFSRLKGRRVGPLELDDADFEGLAAAAVFHHTRALADAPIDRFPGMLLGRLNDHQQQWLIGIAARSESASQPVECARALRFLRYEQELSDVQGQIASMQRDGDLGEQFNTLLARKYDLRMQLEALKEAGASRESA